MSNIDIVTLGMAAAYTNKVASKLSEEIEELRESGGGEVVTNAQPLMLRKTAPVVVCKPISNDGFNITSVHGPSLSVRYKNQVHITGKNMFDFVSAYGGAGYTKTSNGVTITVQDDHTMRVVGTNTSTSWVNFLAENIDDDYWLPPGNFYLPKGLDIKAVDYFGKDLGNKYSAFHMDAPWKITRINTPVAGGATVDNVISLWLVMGVYCTDVSLPYEGWTSGSIGMPTTFGGAHNYRDGSYTRTHTNYASYAGEAVNGEWISSTNALENGASVTGKLAAPYEAAEMFKGAEIPNVAGKECYIWSMWDKVVVDYAVSSDEYAEEIKKAAKSLIPDKYKTLVKLYLWGDTTLMTKDKNVTLAFEYHDPTTGRIVRGILTMKWQGSSSIAYDKKNFTIESVEVFEVKDGWGAETKYCLKANYIDHSHARNLCAAKLWGEVVKSRSTIPDGLGDLVNGGAVDGFPILLYINGEYHGLYTWNIPKDGWMMGMPTEGATQEAIVCAEGFSDATRFFGLATEDNFAIEYVTDENNSAWVMTSVNTLIQAVIDSDGTDLETTLAQYIDWQSAIDYYIFTVLLTGADMMDKNYLMFTRDGAKWYFSAYDLDTTFGLHYNGKSFYPTTNRPTFAQFADYHKLMGLIKTYKKDELKARYNQLRAGVLSESNVAYVFSNFIGSIPTPVYDSDVERWPSIPSSAASNLAQIITQYNIRCAIIDKEIAAM